MKRKTWVCLLIVMILLFALALNSAATTPTANKSKKIGETIKEYINYREKQEESSEKKKIKKSNLSKEILYAKANDFVITKEELENQKEMYEYTVSQSPEEDAFNHLVERKTLYAYATKNGCIVSDKEVEECINSLKEDIKNAEPETKTMAEEVIEAAGGEDNYWNGMKSSYKESLSIDKYISMEKSKFLSQKGLKETDSNADSLWEKYYSKLLKKLIQSENIKK